MDVLAAYKVGITVLIPVFSAITCGALVALSLRDCLSEEERKLKKIMLVYLSLSGVGWYMTFCYEFHPELFTCLNVPCLLSFVLPSIFFYRIIRYLTRLGKPERFSQLHYLLPGLLAAVLLLWSLFVPMDVQIQIVKGKALFLPEGYESYAHFFTSKPLLRVIFGLAYYLFTIAVLIQYYKKSNGKRSPVRRTAGWVIFLVGISIASLLSSLLPTFMPRATILHSLWTFLAASAMAFQHVLLSYHIIRRKYRLYTMPESTVGQTRLTPVEVITDTITNAVEAAESAMNAAETPETATNVTRTPVSAANVARTPVSATNVAETPENASEPDSKPLRRHHNGKLSRKHFEAYFRDKKPWLNPACKITDLVDVFDVNRTTLSAFINRTYGMNFCRYINHWRIRELERIRSMPSNRGKSARSLVEKAGFDNYRTYLRAMAAEREAEIKSPEKDKKKGGTP